MNEMKYRDEILSVYIDALSSAREVPGGGSASSVAAALGGSLNLMVIRISSKKAGADASKKLAVIEKAQADILERFKRYIDLDCSVFTELMSSIKDKNQTPAHFKRAASVPMDICRDCAESLLISRDLLENCSRSLISDVVCASVMLEAAFHSARQNVEANLPGIDGREKEAFLTEFKRMDPEITQVCGDIKKYVSEVRKVKDGHSN